MVMSRGPYFELTVNVFEAVNLLHSLAQVLLENVN